VPKLQRTYDKLWHNISSDWGRAFPKVRLVYGDLDAVELIEEEASNADIVYHFANCDHEASADAIAKGLARRSREGPGYWIHTSGTLILGWETMEHEEYGNRLDKVFDDWDGVAALTSQPDQAAHRNASSPIPQPVAPIPDLR
jgi:hypothetical protein